MLTTTQFELEFTEVATSDLPTAAILVAAGNATRMGGNKQFLPLLGIPVLARSLMAFQNCPQIRDIVVVARKEEIPDVQRLADEYFILKLTAVVAGGAQRQDSVEHGLLALADDIVYVAIHDGARPMITPASIEAVLTDARAHGAAALGVPVKDTIKQVDGQMRIERTIPRETLYAVQTPQVFDVAIYKKALDYAKANALAVTDDCMLCEAAGFPVFITTGSYSNIKITTPEDIAVAENYLAGEEQP